MVWDFEAGTRTVPENRRGLIRIRITALPLMYCLKAFYNKGKYSIPAILSLTTNGTNMHELLH
jgi:hypothetical protein